MTVEGFSSKVVLGFRGAHESGQIMCGVLSCEEITDPRPNFDGKVTEGVGGHVAEGMGTSWEVIEGNVESGSAGNH